MDLLLLSRQLLKVIAKCKLIYVRVTPEVPDFTDKQTTGQIIVSTTAGEIIIPFSRETISKAVALLSVSVFQDPSRVLLVWNFKHLFTFIKYHTKRLPDVHCDFYDLKLISRFLELPEIAPVAFEDCQKLAITISRDDSWKRLHKEIFKPLITTVLPSIETEGMVDESIKKVVYPCYEIGGIKSGRFNVINLDRGFNPHTIGENSSNYRSRDPDKYHFLTVDYRAMEAAALQWLSQDKALAELLKEVDFYSALWKMLFKSHPSSENRKKCKELFLPIFYGQGIEATAKSLGLNTIAAKAFHEALEKTFSDAWKYIISQQQKAKLNDGDYQEPFGRKRNVGSKHYLARNHCIQSVGAVFCQESLIRLHRQLPCDCKLVFHVHDGYTLFCDHRRIKEVYHRVKKILEQESELCPGLKIGISGKSGKNLKNMFAIV